MRENCCRNPFVIRSMFRTYKLDHDYILRRQSRNPFVIRSMFRTEYRYHNCRAAVGSQSLRNQVNVSNRVGGLPGPRLLC